MKAKKFIKKFHNHYKDFSPFINTLKNGRLQFDYTTSMFDLNKKELSFQSPDGNKYVIPFNEVILKKPIQTTKSFMGDLPISVIGCIPKPIYSYISEPGVLNGCINWGISDHPTVRLPLNPEFIEDTDRIINKIASEYIKEKADSRKRLYEFCSELYAGKAYIPKGFIVDPDERIKIKDLPPPKRVSMNAAESLLLDLEVDGEKLATVQLQIKGFCTNMATNETTVDITVTDYVERLTLENTIRDSIKGSGAKLIQMDNEMEFYTVILPEGFNSIDTTLKGKHLNVSFSVNDTKKNIKLLLVGDGRAAVNFISGVIKIGNSD